MILTVVDRGRGGPRPLLKKKKVFLPLVVGRDSNLGRGEPLQMMTNTSVSRGAQFLAVHSSWTDAL